MNLAVTSHAPPPTANTCTVTHTVPRGDLAMMASDHLPLVADLRLVAEGVTAR